MDTRVDEIAERIYRFSTFVPDIGPSGFTFNQFLVDADEPLLFHTGHRAMFPSVSAAVATVTPLERLRWIAFGHLEADECGAMNLFLAASPAATVAHNALGCMVSIGDLADRPPRPMGEGEVLDLGGRRVRNIDTPHVPHGWDAHLLYEEVTGTLFCSDLFTQLGDAPALSAADPMEGASVAEDVFRATSITPGTGPAIRALRDLRPKTLAIMHGPSYAGDCAAALDRLADDYDRRLSPVG
jgi:flavorubredoxin